MPFDPFLKQVADYYVVKYRDSVSDLTKVCFVFPNHRSGYFFGEYFKQAFIDDNHKALILPRITTLSSLAESWCRMVEATPLELAMLLFRVYLDKVHPAIENGSPALEPEKFLFWGDMIINDFNDVDKALAPAHHLFRNLKDYKEEQTNPLDDEMLALIKQFWDTTGVPWLDVTDGRMWVYEDRENWSEGMKNFIKLWEVLGPLYDEFREALMKQGLCYVGMAYREALKVLETRLENDERLDADQYVFVGFSSLSNSEKKIFSILKKAGLATFHWDNNLPDLGMEEPFPLRLVENYQRLYPDPADLEIVYPDYQPEIEIYATSTDIGQVKEVARIIKKDVDDKLLTPATALNYALVLPETSLCLPMVGSLSLPSDIDMNITMGLPIKGTAIAMVMEAVAMLTATSSTNTDGTTFFNRNAVVQLVSLPILVRWAPDECKEILDMINNVRGLFVNGRKLKEKAGKIEFLFALPNNLGVMETLEEMKDVAGQLLELCDEPVIVERKRMQRGKEKTVEVKRNLESEFLEVYIEVLDDFKDLVEKYELAPFIEEAGEHAFSTVGKMLRRVSMVFMGAPLKGIQMMGVLETRALDFNKVFITSMNERSFPRKLMKATFIPQNLRRAYGLENIDDEETVMAYHFYRLIGRAHNVVLLYNNNTDGTKSGEMSRYIYQLKYLFRYPKMTEKVLKYPGWVAKGDRISVTKTDDIMKRLSRFLPSAPDGEKRYFSASSLKKLLGCPLEFLLATVNEYSESDQDFTHIDDSVYGTMVHYIMENVYSDSPGGKAVVTPAEIDRILASKRIEALAIESANEAYPTDFSDKKADVTGEVKIFCDMAIQSVRAMLKGEKKLMEKDGYERIEIVETEVSKDMTLRLNDDLSVNFRYIIDRVDRVVKNNGESFLRIVDYKTGGDILKFNGVEALFKFTSTDDRYFAPQAITQLMIYSVAYARDPVNGIDEDMKIQPIIYKFRDAVSGKEISPLKEHRGYKNDVPFLNYKEIENRFMELLETHLVNLFDPKEKFMQVETTNTCKYCDFKALCGRK